MEEPGAGYCLWGRKESDTTERLHSLTHSLNDATIPISRTYEYVTLDDKRALRLLIHQPRGREIILDYLGRPSNQQDP